MELILMLKNEININGDYNTININNITNNYGSERIDHMMIY